MASSLNNKQFINAQVNAVDFNSPALDIRNNKWVALQPMWTKGAPAAGAFAAAAVSVANDTATITAHGYKTGLKGQLTTTTTLPAGLSTSTDYYIIVVDANTVAFATSQANAVAGTKINITDQGTGTHTFTANTTLAGTVDIQVSADYDPNSPILHPGTWFAIVDGAGNSVKQTFSATGGYAFNVADIAFPYCRLAFVVTSGQITTTVAVAGKE